MSASYDEVAYPSVPLGQTQPDRMAVIAGGKCVAVGTLDELRVQAGRNGTLEQVFGALTHSADPHAQAVKLLG